LLMLLSIMVVVLPVRGQAPAVEGQRLTQAAVPMNYTL
jgi:hypothetical protein